MLLSSFFHVPKYIIPLFFLLGNWQSISSRYEVLGNIEIGEVQFTQVLIESVLKYNLTFMFFIKEQT